MIDFTNTFRTLSEIEVDSEFNNKLNEKDVKIIEKL